ncbi:hypothetical protein D9M72_432540 [compost metagenome]
MRAPVMPNGCPRAIAPPWTLSREWSMPSSRELATTWTANASFSSTRSMSPMPSPARASACRVASTGPMPMSSGESALTPVDTIRASGSRPSSRARPSLITTRAAAPSFSGHALPAVTVPSLRNTGWSPATPSRVTPLRGESSRSTTVPSRRAYGVMSREKNPEARAASARFWLRTAHSSCSAREIP